MARTRPNLTPVPDVDSDPPELPSYSALTASARILPKDKRFAPRYDTWQDQAWELWDRVGEFEYGTSWLANMMSRCRLLAAEVMPGGDEPKPIPTGPHAEAIERLAGGTAGQAQLLNNFSKHLSVPGECWLIGEPPASPLDEEIWSVRSANELQITTRRTARTARGARTNPSGYGYTPTYEVLEGPNRDRDWRQLPPDTLIVRVWRSHPRYNWQADSPARHALGALVEVDAINKRILATVLSRLASNGILLYDKGRLSFPNRTNPSDPNQVDPFAQVLVEVASKGIADPTSPEAVLPIPIGFVIDDLENVDPKLLMQFIQGNVGVDEKMLAMRESAVRRLATSLDLPAEILLGIGDVNHWNAWFVEESAIKAHLEPDCQVICHSLTVGYLHPYLEAAGIPLTGPNGGKVIVWYDPSEITQAPDNGERMIQAYDRMEISGAALRRGIGASDADAPSSSELTEQALKMLVRNGSDLSAAALQELGGPELQDLSARGEVTGAESENPNGNPPSTKGGPPRAGENQPSTSPGYPTKLVTIQWQNPKTYGTNTTIPISPTALPSTAHVSTVDDDDTAT